MAKPLSAIEKLKLAKLGKAKLSDSVDTKARVVYDTVTEEEYQKIVKDKIKKGNFIEGEGA